MEFAPLGYLWRSLTVWHLLIWIGVTLALFFFLRRKENQSPPLSWIPLAAASLALLFAIFALIIGQIFGANYSAMQIWPSGMVIGGLFAMLAFLQSRISDQAKDLPIWLMIAGVVIAGNFNAFCIWLFPRIMGFGLIDFPRLSWGVQL